MLFWNFNTAMLLQFQKSTVNVMPNWNCNIVILLQFQKNAIKPVAFLTRLKTSKKAQVL